MKYENRTREQLKHTKKLLKEAEQKYRILTEKSPNMIFSTKKDGWSMPTEDAKKS